MPAWAGMLAGRAALHNGPMKTGIALCAAISIDEASGQAPDWLHLLPAGVARTVDGRGPYRVNDAAALMAASMAATGGKLVLCENHATDLAAPKGGSAPARGWIVELQHRGDGIWGRVEWTAEGRRLIEEREYRGVSPVIAHDRSGAVSAILRATLTNTPNLAGLRSLHHQENDDMALRDTLIAALGLDGAADDAAIVAAVQAGREEGGVALQSALKPIAQAAGVAEDADAAAVLAGVQALKTGAGDSVSLQAQVDRLTEDAKRDKSTAFVDAAIGAGRVGVKPKRDRYITMHMADPAGTADLISALPVLAPGAKPTTVVTEEGAPENPALLSQKATAYVAAQAAIGITVDFATAVRTVHGGKAA